MAHKKNAGEARLEDALARRAAAEAALKELQRQKLCGEAVDIKDMIECLEGSEPGRLRGRYSNGHLLAVVDEMREQSGQDCTPVQRSLFEAVLRRLVPAEFLQPAIDPEGRWGRRIEELAAAILQQFVSFSRGPAAVVAYILLDLNELSAGVGPVPVGAYTSPEELDRINNLTAWRYVVGAATVRCAVGQAAYCGLISNDAGGPEGEGLSVGRRGDLLLTSTSSGSTDDEPGLKTLGQQLPPLHEIQNYILEELDGQARSRRSLIRSLQKAGVLGSDRTFDRHMKTLVDSGRVKSSRGIGYFRPDRPPPQP